MRVCFSPEERSNAMVSKLVECVFLNVVGLFRCLIGIEETEMAQNCSLDLSNTVSFSAQETEIGFH